MTLLLNYLLLAMGTMPLELGLNEGLGTRVRQLVRALFREVRTRLGPLSEQ